MSEEDYQRGRRGAEFRIGGDWNDWKAGRDELDRENRKAERAWEGQLDAEIDASLKDVLPPDEFKAHLKRRVDEAEDEYNKLIASQAAARRRREEYEQNQKNQKCFIATAAFGRSSPSVKILQDYRDRFLCQSRWGAAVVRLYYRMSPRLASFIAEADWRRHLARAVLKPVVLFAARKIERVESPLDYPRYCKGDQRRLSG